VTILAPASDHDDDRSVVLSLIVEPDESGVRVDSFIVKRKLVPSSAAARRAIAAGVVYVDGHAAKKGHRLEAGQRVGFGEPPVDEAVLRATPELVLPVLYEDAALVAVDKPAGVPSHPLRAGEGATVAGALVARFPECAAASLDAREGGLGHRLDIGTSGVIVAARSREIWHRLREVLSEAACEKIYIAQVAGRFPQDDEFGREFVVPGPFPASFVVDCPIGRQGRHGGRVLLASGRQPLPARTVARRIEALPDGDLVEARLSHGRAHQVRAHLAYLGIPVLGDSTYGERAGEGTADISLRLHAWAISFLHPTTGKPLRIEAPLPAWARASDRIR
jgi:23S rRNA pseudouridine1911/1915/1917 synthase